MSLDQTVKIMLKKANTSADNGDVLRTYQIIEEIRGYHFTEFNKAPNSYLRKKLKKLEKQAAVVEESLDFNYGN